MPNLRGWSCSRGSHLWRSGIRKVTRGPSVPGRRRQTRGEPRVCGLLDGACVCLAQWPLLGVVTVVTGTGLELLFPRYEDEDFFISSIIWGGGWRQRERLKDPPVLTADSGWGSISQPEIPRAGQATGTGISKTLGFVRIPDSQKVAELPLSCHPKPVCRVSAWTLVGSGGPEALGSLLCSSVTFRAVSELASWLSCYGREPFQNSGKPCGL